MSLIEKFLALLSSPSVRERPAALLPSREAAAQRIQRWKAQLTEYERLGCRELARHLRASIHAHERALASRVA